MKGLHKGAEKTGCINGLHLQTLQTNTWHQASVRDLEFDIGDMKLGIWRFSIHKKISEKEAITAVLLATFSLPLLSAPAGQGQETGYTLISNGRKMLDQRRLNEALDTFGAYCRSHPRKPDGYFWMAVTLDEFGRYDMAIFLYKQALDFAEKENLDSAETRINLGNVYLKQGKIEEALCELKQAIAFDPSLAVGHLNYGRALLAKGMAQEALERWKVCDELRFRSYQLPYYRAKALLNLGKKDEAKAMIDKLLIELPNGPHKEALAREFADLIP